MRFVFFFLLALYATWFWWSGMERFKDLPPQPASCPGIQFGFLFHRVNLFQNWYRKTNFGIAVTAASLIGIVFVGYIAYYYQAIWGDFCAAFKEQTSKGGFGGLMAMAEGAEAGEPVMPIGAKQLNASKSSMLEGHTSWWRPVLATTWMVGCIIAVELLIVWNSINGVDTVLSTGQLIPFVIGIGGLIKICFRWWQVSKVKKVKRTGGNTSLGGNPWLGGAAGHKQG